MRSCEVAGCGRKYRSKGYCGGHYSRLRQHGSPLEEIPLKVQVSSPEESFLLRTEPLLWSGCLVWTGYRNDAGYGYISVEGRSVLVHRYAWEQEYGPIPDGIQIDHRYHCDTACCETSHLRPATAQQNSSNRSGVRSGRTHDLPRNVSPSTHGGYDARVRKGGVIHIRHHATVAAAAAEAERMRGELFGEFAGNG